MKTQDKNYYDIDFINAIPIEQILNDYGIDVKRGFFKARDERTPSCKIYTDKNIYIDFGDSNKGGGPIHLVQTLEKCTWYDAVEKLAARYSIAPKNRAKKTKGKYMSKKQYEQIGFEFPRDYKQAIHVVSELNTMFENDTAAYTDLLKNIALPYVKDQRSLYLQELRQLQKSNVYEDVMYKLQYATTMEALKNYNHVFESLQTAAKGTPLNINNLKADFAKDSKNINKLSIEIGYYPYADLKQQPGQTVYQQTNERIYNVLAANYEDTPPYSAFIKGDTVNLAYKKEHKPFFENTLEMIETTIKSEAKKPAIYVCSPLAGEIAKNIQLARTYSETVSKIGGVPFAPHITEMFDDQIPKQREMGISYGIDLLKRADELWIFGNRISSGMMNEIAVAKKIDIPIYKINIQTNKKVPFDDDEQRRNATRQQRQNYSNKKPLVYICASCNEDFDKLAEQARELGRIVIQAGGTPLSADILGLSNHELGKGTQLEVDLLSKADELWVFGTPNEHMQDEIQWANQNKVPVYSYNEKTHTKQPYKSIASKSHELEI